MIQKLNKQRISWEMVIPFLHRLHADAKAWKELLENTGVTINSWRVLVKKVDYENYKNSLNDFKTAYGTWFNDTFPDWNDALDGAITSLGNIITHIDSYIASYYMDAETGKPILTDLSQAHRDTLASDINDELE